MRLISLARADDGAELGRDVLIGRPDGVPLLRAGVKLTPRYRELLSRAGISAIYVEDELSDGIIVDPIIDDQTRAVATRAVSGAYNSARDAISRGRQLAPEAVKALDDVVRRILEQIESSGGVAVALADLSSADGYTFQHSIDVTALGLLIGSALLQRPGLDRLPRRVPLRPDGGPALDPRARAAAPRHRQAGDSARDPQQAGQAHSRRSGRS